jgi:hypothetical protein
LLLAAPFVFDRSGPPTEVGVLAGGSLAGNDSSISSSSFSSAALRGARDGFFAGSFMSIAPVENMHASYVF